MRNKIETLIKRNFWEMENLKKLEWEVRREVKIMMYYYEILDLLDILKIEMNSEKFEEIIKITN